MAEKKFLIVDDSAIMRQLLIIAVRKIDIIEPLTLVEANNGKDAFDKFKADRFDLVITDIEMPKMSGLELIVKLREELGDKTVPIIAISVDSDETNILRALNLGANEYLVKPISIMRLKEAVTRLLGCRPTRFLPSERAAKALIF